MKFKEISKWLPSTDDEWLTMFAAIRDGSDREAAIMASAFLEQTLRLALGCSFVENTHVELFEGTDAPLSAFSAKIRMAHALAIAGPTTRKKLDTIRKFRNAFAHSLLPFDFDKA